MNHQLIDLQRRYITLFVLTRSGKVSCFMRNIRDKFKDTSQMFYPCQYIITWLINIVLIEIEIVTPLLDIL